MQQPKSPVFWLALIVAACGAQDPILNSERIARTFGSYGIDVIQADGNRRVSSLYSGSGESKVTRTFAVVTWSGGSRRAYASEHALVQSGQSIGAVFESAGWDIEKLSLFIGELEIPDEYGLVAGLMQVDLPISLATHVYELVVRKNDHSYGYATIVELHHPDYLSAKDLEMIYGEIIFDDSNRDSIDDFVDPEIWEN